MGRFNFAQTGWYRFTITSDDGVKFFVDGSKKLDKWNFQNATFTVDVYLTAGNHWLDAEWFEDYGSAAFKLYWQKL